MVHVGENSLCCRVTEKWMQQETSIEIQSPPSLLGQEKEINISVIGYFIEGRAAKT